jgi:hypothetical protein
MEGGKCDEIERYSIGNFLERSGASKGFITNFTPNQV